MNQPLFLNFLLSETKNMKDADLMQSALDVQVNHQRRYSKKGLIDLFSNTNLKIVKVHYVDFIGWITLLLSKILRLKLFVSQKYPNTNLNT